MKTQTSTGKPPWWFPIAWTTVFAASGLLVWICGRVASYFYPSEIYRSHYVSSAVLCVQLLVYGLSTASGTRRLLGPYVPRPNIWYRNTVVVCVLSVVPPLLLLLLGGPDFVLYPYFFLLLPLLLVSDYAPIVAFGLIAGLAQAFAFAPTRSASRTVLAALTWLVVSTVSWCVMVALGHTVVDGAAEVVPWLLSSFAGGAISGSGMLIVLLYRNRESNKHQHSG